MAECALVDAVDIADDALNAFSNLVRPSGRLCLFHTTAPRPRAVDFFPFLEAQGSRYAVEYRVPGNYLTEELWLPLEVLKDVQGSTTEPVAIASPRPGIVAVRWTERGALKVKEYPLSNPSSPGHEFPRDAANWTEQPPGLMSALRDAAAVTGDSGVRYALHCLQLSGQGGHIAATDGQQLLVQSGWNWGFNEDLLVARTPLFGSLEPSLGETLRIGTTDAHLVLNLGRWKFWLPLETDVCFPDCLRIVPAPETPVTTWQLTPADVEFLRSKAGQLPRRSEAAFVTIDLGNPTSVRAAGGGNCRPRFQPKVPVDGLWGRGPHTRERRLLAARIALRLDYIRARAPSVKHNIHQTSPEHRHHTGDGRYH